MLLDQGVGAHHAQVENLGFGWSWLSIEDDGSVCTEFALAANADDATTDGANLDTDGLSSSGRQAAFRFTGMSVLAGATITSAKLAVVTRTGGAVISHSTLITCEDADSAAAFSDGEAHSAFTSRARTAGTAWDISDGAIADETEYESPNFSSDLQEVIDRAGWTDTAQVFWDNDGSNPTLNIYMRDLDPTFAAVLRVCYVPFVPEAADDGRGQVFLVTRTVETDFLI